MDLALQFRRSAGEGYRDAGLAAVGDGIVSAAQLLDGSVSLARAWGEVSADTPSEPSSASDVFAWRPAFNEAEHTPLRAWAAAAPSGDDSTGFGACMCLGCTLSKSQLIKQAEVVVQGPQSPDTPLSLGDDIGDDISSTTRINLGQTITSSLSPAGDLDFFRVSVVAGQTYAISLSSGGLTNGVFDTYLEVRSTTGALLGEDDDSGVQLNSFLLFTAQTTGDVFLVARSFDSAQQPATTGDYRISINPITTGNTTNIQFDDNGKPFFSWDQAGVQITRTGATWSPDFGQGTVVTYAYRATAATLPSDVSGFTQFTANQIQFTEAAFAAWADVANITFQRVGSGLTGPGAYSDDAAILIGGYTSGAAGAAAFAFLPSSANRSSTSNQGDIWVNVTQSANATMSFGGYGPHTMLHEIGHAIGLSHPSNYNASENANPNYAFSASYFNDSRMFSAMSYFGSVNTQGSLPFFSAAPQLHDIAAAQRLYGPNMNTRTGDTVYGFNSNAGLSHFAISGPTQAVVFAIWDAGGNDTLDFSGYSERARVDLREEAFSSVGPGPGVGTVSEYNVAIARGAIVENAITGSADDEVRGNAAANVLNSGAGSDELFGLDGNDTLIGGAGGDRLDGGNGFDYASYQNAGAGVIADLVNALNNTGDALGDTFIAIEGLIGSNSGDTLTGNASDNRFRGLAGNDTLNGGAGRDTAEYLQASSAVSWNRNPNGSWTVNAGADGTDSLTNVEFLDFADRDVVLDNARRNIYGDGTSDIIWFNPRVGYAAWSITGTAINRTDFLGGAGPEWTLVGTADFFGDGRDDFLWRRNDGLVALWRDGQVTQGELVAGVGTEWSIVGLGDFNFDGRDDILWNNPNVGVAAWNMNGATAQSQSLLPGGGGEWSVLGVGDFNGDGSDDVLWRSTSGAIAQWQTNGVSVTGQAYVSNLNNTWQLGGVGDFDGDGRDDLVWRNTDGAVLVWRMDGGNILQQGFLFGAGNEWSLESVGDFNGDGRDDLLWRRGDGVVAYWAMDGVMMASGSFLAFVASEWSIL